MSGVVSDMKTRAPIASAKVSIAGGLATHDAMSDVNGTFILEFPANQKCGKTVELRVSKSGYKSTEKLESLSSVIPVQILLQPTTRARTLPKTTAPRSTPAASSSLGNSVNWRIFGTNSGPIANGKKNEFGQFIPNDVVWSIATMAPDRPISTPMILELTFGDDPDEPQEIFGEPYIALHTSVSDTTSVTMSILKHEGTIVTVKIVDPPLTPSSFLFIRTYGRSGVITHVKCVSCPSK